MFKKISILVGLIVPAIVLGAFIFGKQFKEISKDVLFPSWDKPVWKDGKRASEMPFKFYGCNPVAEIKIGENKILVVLDTGTTSTALDYDVVSSVANVWPVIPSLLNVATLPRLDIGNLQFSNVRVAAFKAGPGVWPKSTMGLVGSDFFKNVTVIFNPKSMTVKFMEPGLLKEENFDHRVPIEFSDSRRNRPHVLGKINGGRGRLLFDTGNMAYDLILSPKFRSSNPTVDENSYPHPKGAPWKISKEITVDLSGLEIKNIETALYEDVRGPFDPNEAGNLGCGILKKNFSLIAIDYSTDSIYIKY